MSFRKTLLPFAVVGLAASLLGCFGYYEYLGRSGKPNIHSVTETDYEPKSYQVLGLVKATGTGSAILGIVLQGDDGQGLLWEAAISKFGERVTGLKDVSSSSKYRAILPPIFAEIQTTYYAVAVQER
jgi:hypothetical protein